ncbi:subtilisin-like protein, partial [Hanseniaspora valbyensis NRRL Y-1626]
FNGFEAIKTTLDPELFNELKLNPFVADIDTNEKFQAFSFIPNKKSSNHDFEEYEEEEEEEEDDDNDDKDNNKKDKDNNGIAIQYTAPRHLVRLSRRSKLSLDDSSNLNYYYQNKFTGKDVSVYILDTGIAANHPQLGGRVRHGESFVNEPSGDFNGHGSHVAGIVGSKDYGVCKNCELVEVKCLNKNGQGDLTTVISAIEFAVGDMIKTGKKSVANLSLGSFRSKILNEAVKAAVDNGMVMVVAAGNSNMNACLNSPASEPAAITVGAIDDKNDQIASFSNWGECVDIFASGVKVESLSFSDFDNPVKFSGTSMATPSVAGLAAVLLDMGVKNDQIKDKLIAFSSKDFIKRRHLLMRPRTPNRLLFNGVSSAENE